VVTDALEAAVAESSMELRVRQSRAERLSDSDAAVLSSGECEQSSVFGHVGSECPRAARSEGPDVPVRPFRALRETA
jgi:hypothetical protein